MRTRKSGGSLVLLHRDGRSQVGVTSSGEGATSRKFKTNVFSQLFGKNIDKGVVRPAESEGMRDVLESDC